MRTTYFYKLDTGLFTGQYESNSGAAMAPTVPDGCGAFVGDIDPYASRMDLDTGEVVTYQPPPPPSTELIAYEWDESIMRWIGVKTSAGQQADLQAAIVLATQARLDAFARTRNYDGILSAATYASSGIAKFALEGQHCVTARDATWATLYSVLAEVQAGTRALPESFADIEPLLPVLDWPTP